MHLKIASPHSPALAYAPPETKILTIAATHASFKTSTSRGFLSGSQIITDNPPQQHLEVSDSIVGAPRKWLNSYKRKNTMSLPHFSRHHEDREAFGPFSFLNPTTRRIPFPRQQHQDEDSSQDDQQTKEHNDASQEAKSSKPQHEIPADDVSRLYRTRDNRKGKYLVACT